MVALTDKQSNYLTIILIGVMPLLVTPFFSDVFYGVKVVFTVAVTGYFLIKLHIALFQTSTIKWNIIDTLLGSYVVFILLSFAFSIDKAQGIIGFERSPEGIVVLLTYVAIFFIFRNLNGINEGCFNIIAVFVCLISLYGVLQFYDVVPMLAQGANLSTIGNQNFVGSYCTLLLPLFVYFYIHDGKIQYLITTVLLFMLLLCSLTRSGWLAFFVWAPLLWLLNRKEDIKQKRWGYVFAILLSFIVVVVIMDITSGHVFFKRVSMLFNDAMHLTDDKAGSWRMHIWKKSLPLVHDRPLTGSGPDTFGDVFVQQDVKDSLKNMEFLKAHNEYLQIVLTLGIPALLVYLSIVAVTLARIVQTMKTNKVYTALFCAIIGYLIQAFFNISVISTAPIYWAFLGIGAQRGNSY